MISCNGQNKYHVDLPQNADVIWVGGEDGGCYLKFLDQKNDTFHILIYSDQSFESPENVYFYNPNHEIKIDTSSLYNNINFYDGDIIDFLKDGKHYRLYKIKVN